MITTIIFDLSEVYLHGTLGVESSISLVTGMEVAEHSLYSIDEAKQFFHGQITEEAFFQAVIRKHNWPITVTELKKIIRQHMTEIKGTREVIEKLKINGYKLGLLSVHAKEWIEYCEAEFDYHKLFDAVMYSFEVGVSKPEPKAFELILKKLGVQAAECLFIDDKMANVSSAQELGMQAVQFENPTQLEEEIKKLGIKL